jgi:hypothetical protein
VILSYLTNLTGVKRQIATYLRNALFARAETKKSPAKSTIVIRNHALLFILEKFVFDL